MRYESVFEVWICDTHTRFYVDVTTFPDEEVVKTLGPYHSYRQAVRALGGVSTNMNHDRFTARSRQHDQTDNPQSTAVHRWQIRRRRVCALLGRMADQRPPHRMVRVV